MSNPVNDPKCYPVGFGIRGWISNFKGGGRWMFFDTEAEYYAYFKEAKEAA